jgi:ATP-binding cassette subfamily F protein 3
VEQEVRTITFHFGIPAKVGIPSAFQIIGDDTPAIDSVLQADVWRHKLLTEEKDINAQLEEFEKKNSADLGEAEKVRVEAEKDELSGRLGDVQKSLMDMEAETGPARASSLLAGLGFTDEDQKKPTRAFSGGWRSVRTGIIGTDYSEAFRR